MPFLVAPFRRWMGFWSLPEFLVTLWTGLTSFPSLSCFFSSEASTVGNSDKSRNETSALQKSRDSCFLKGLGRNLRRLLCRDWYLPPRRFITCCWVLNHVLPRRPSGFVRAWWCPVSISHFCCWLLQRIRIHQEDSNLSLFCEKGQ